jgi:hypothetical protein
MGGHELLSFCLGVRLRHLFLDHVLPDLLVFFFLDDGLPSLSADFVHEGGNDGSILNSLLQGSC